MKILLVNKYFYRKGGAETYFFDLAEGLRALGHEVAFFSMQHPNNEDSYWSKYFVSEKDYVGKISAFRQAKEAATLIYSFEAKRKFEALLEEFKPDVIHLNNVHRQLTLSILDAPYLKRHHVPVVYTAHDYILLCPAYTMVNGHGKVCDLCLNRRFKHALDNTCVKGSKAKSALAMMEAEFLKWHKSYDKIDLIIAPSEFMKRKLEEGGYAGRVVAMQNFLTTSQMEMAQKVVNTHKFEDEAAGQHPYFLFFGRLSKEKGILTLVQAFLKAAGLRSASSSPRAEQSEVEGSHPVLPSNWNLHIVGDGPERQAVERMINSAGAEAQSRIKLLGYKTGKDLQREVGNARFSVLCSEWRENMPYSGLESLAAQTPVIGANIGGLTELIKEGENGLGFLPQNIVSLANALLSAVNIKKDNYAQMQQRSAAYINRRCKQDGYVSSLEKRYQSVLVRESE
ncbi:glycosyltransferase [Bifidobacterium eulemuris]|uniref:Glycosyltransferase n=1 Tax=Bifidobacterium eulemuris TaxID=1765219 RepID=A0A261GAV9_9BIFI|nr:glycosyltransferase [Bifidobacterium eulemuris]OZG68540.1 glycosyltransferase family 1 [Bifidobacterium eulemuris]QOL32670.1 glycosyltransferase [Bifidobacterium eulemuris]